jgi:hypothetical protein
MFLSSIRNPQSASRNDLSRRGFLNLSARGMALGCMSGWLGALAARAADGKSKPKACILLWMTGGPSHLDTFDLKPEAPSNIRGEFKPIDTTVPGIQISEHFPKFARQMQHAAVIRGMTTPEAEHVLATYHMHTGYQRRGGGLSFPCLGSIASAELGKPDFPLPNCVVIGPGPREATRSGFLGPRHQPLDVKDPGRGVENLKALVDGTRFDRQLDLLGELERSFYKNYQAPASEAHTTTLQSAVKLMRAKEAKAFDLSEEPAKNRDAYGPDAFAQGCLLARRLVEVGVPFIEVNMANPSWDTHQQNFPRTKALSAQVDPPMAALIEDLKGRGLLDSTLVVWMGEFGRTPECGGGGRQHYPKAWSTVLIGGGIKGGQVIGKTDSKAATVTDRPVTVTDFLATICLILGIDYKKSVTPPGVDRPIRIVEKKPGENPITELLG